jgi:pyruvate dehydrogenase E2 component (dihydrolipoamide acetyltransferase)
MPKLRAFTMPKWGIEMVEGTVSKWSVNEGESVKKGATIVLIETDKIVNEVEAESDTTFVRILAGPGDTVPVGALLGVMADGAASTAEVDAFVTSLGGATAAVAVVERDVVVASVSVPVAAVATPAARAVPDIAISPAALAFAEKSAVELNRLVGSGRKGRVTYQDVVQASRPVRAVGGGAAVSVMPTTGALAGVYVSPAAARMAVAQSIDLKAVRGTGPRGRISRRDITPDVNIIRMSPMRKAIARQLTLSKTTVPHFYVRMDMNLEAMLEMRAQEKLRSGRAPGLNDYMVKATASALMAVPEVNIQVHGEEIRQFAGADIAIAVATDKGLLTPVLRGAEGKTLKQISAELRPLVERARAGSLKSQEIEGGSFTISNLGMFGVEQFDAIINIPQGAILAIGAARRVCVERAGFMGFASMATFSLSCDHRAIDGAVAGRFLKALRGFIETPAG